ncbi:hypothetical protein B6U99_07845 [Candidatus Geothermarchaeota archaeon ex4572_27]|nr:MAG: hypothetical protein B6U99_07845 [Candidatus Geothermarchaeota archaeon ex4572_27]
MLSPLNWRVMLDYREVAACKALADEVRRSILDLLSCSGPLSIDEISRSIGLKKATVQYHLRILEQAGLVRPKLEAKSSPGRPRKLYEATKEYLNLSFPKRQYELLLRLLMGSLARERGYEELVRLMESSGRELGRSVLLKVKSLHSVDKWDMDAFCRYILPELRELGFNPLVSGDCVNEVTVKLTNCIFRELLDEYSEALCAWLRAFVSSLMEPFKGFEVRLGRSGEGSEFEDCLTIIKSRSSSQP